MVDGIRWPMALFDSGVKVDDQLVVLEFCVGLLGGGFGGGRDVLGGARLLERDLGPLPTVPGTTEARLGHQSYPAAGTFLRVLRFLGGRLGGDQMLSLALLFLFLEVLLEENWEELSQGIPTFRALPGVFSFLQLAALSQAPLLILGSVAQVIGQQLEEALRPALLGRDPLLRFEAEFEGVGPKLVHPGLHGPRALEDERLPGDDAV